MGEACSVCGRLEIQTGFLWGSLKERVHFEDRCKQADNIKMDLQGVGRGSKGWIDLAYDGQVTGSFQCGVKLKGFIKCRKFLDHLRNCQLFQKNCCMQLYSLQMWRVSRRDLDTPDRHMTLTHSVHVPYDATSVSYCPPDVSKEFCALIFWGLGFQEE